MKDAAGAWLRRRSLGSTADSLQSDLAAASAELKDDWKKQQDIKDQIQAAIARPKYSVSDLYKKEGLFQEIARGAVFENVTLSVICLNAIWMAIDTDYNKAASLLQADVIFQVVEHSFCIYFSLEWYIRLMSFKVKAEGLQDAWFVFDTVLVAMMVGETWVMTAFFALSGTDGQTAAPTGILRLIRLLRLSRMARMLRSVPELLILVKGMASATKSVCYVMCLLLMFMYVFAIALTQITINTELGDDFFADVLASMKTLLLNGVLLDNLSTISKAMREANSMALIAFYAFVLLGNLTVMNMLIGVLCEVVSGVAKDEKEQICVSFVTEKLKVILQSIDEDANCAIDKGEFHSILEDPAAVVALSDVGVDPIGIVDYADYIFDELTTHSEKDVNKEISFEVFMEMVLNLRSTNTATVKDCIDLKKFIKSSFESMDQQVTNRLIDKRGLPKAISSSEVSMGATSSAASPTNTANTAAVDDSMRAALATQKLRTEKLEQGLSSLLLDLRKVRTLTESKRRSDREDQQTLPQQPPRQEGQQQQPKPEEQLRLTSRKEHLRLPPLKLTTKPSAGFGGSSPIGTGSAFVGCAPAPDFAAAEEPTTIVRNPDQTSESKLRSRAGSAGEPAPAPPAEVEFQFRAPRGGGNCEPSNHPHGMGLEQMGLLQHQHHHHQQQQQQQQQEPHDDCFSPHQVQDDQEQVARQKQLYLEYLAQHCPDYQHQYQHQQHQQQQQQHYQQQQQQHYQQQLQQHHHHQ